MTAAKDPASHNDLPGKQAQAVPLRQLVLVAARQHRNALLWTGVVVGVLATALAAVGVQVHELAAYGGRNWYGLTRASVDYGGVLRDLALILQLNVLLAGMFIGAPLLPHEFDHGTTKLAWTQAASRSRWLLAQVLLHASLLTLAALAIGALFGWLLSPFPQFAVRIVPLWPFPHLSLDRIPWTQWSPLAFNLSPLLLAGWTVFAFALGVFLGAAIQRILPAMAATLFCYGAVLLAVAGFWRLHYLPPLHRAIAVRFQQHHIVMSITYQPAGRYHTFQAIELGWLLVASALLVAGAIFLIGRRPA
jgi:hypothetical protein